MATSLEIQTPPAVSPEKRSIYDKIIGYTPDWQEARDRAKRDAFMNSALNMDARDAFAPINGLLDQITELNLLGDDRGE